jgi:hypothetical protein
MPKKKTQKVSKPLHEALVELNVVHSRLRDLAWYTDHAIVDLCEKLSLDPQTLKPVKEEKTVVDDLMI